MALEGGQKWLSVKEQAPITPPGCRDSRLLCVGNLSLAVLKRNVLKNEGAV